MYQDNNPFTATPSMFGKAGMAAVCLLIWGGLLFLAAYIAALVVAIVAIVGIWAFKRVRLMLRLRRLATLRQPAQRARPLTTIAAPRLA